MAANHRGLLPVGSDPESGAFGGEDLVGAEPRACLEGHGAPPAGFAVFAAAVADRFIFRSSAWKRGSDRRGS